MNSLKQLWLWFANLDVGEQAGVAGAFFSGFAFLWGIYVYISRRRLSSLSADTVTSQEKVDSISNVTSTASHDSIAIGVATGNVTIQHKFPSEIVSNNNV